MLARLEHPLELLTAGPRDAPARHQALRDTIGWSVELLDDGERTLFRQLAVFVGGCTLEAVEEVCQGDLDALGSLVDKSLVRASDGRFAMLETIREYAIELLDAASEADDVRQAHAAHYLCLARAAATGPGAASRATWRTALETDHDNIRAALRHSLDTRNAATALQLCAALWRFWFERGYLSEGRLWLNESLAASHEPSRERALALNGNGVLAHYQGDYDRAEELCLDALELFRDLGDATGVAEAQTGIGLVRRTRGLTDEAELFFREALSVYEDLEDEEGVARALDRLAMNRVVAGDMDGARPLFERSLGLFRRLGDPHGIALGLYGLSVARPAGSHAAARAQACESLEILRTVDDRRTFAKVLWDIAEIDAETGDTETGAAQLQESLTLFIEFGDRWFTGLVLESAAVLAAKTDDAERAARLLGAAHAIWTSLEVSLMGFLRERHDRTLARIRSLVDDARFLVLWEEGMHVPLPDTVELVAPARSRDDDAPEGLTARELEVLSLVAEGRTDAEVAEALVVSLRTVHAHLRSVYRKLGVHTRSAATRYALDHGLAA